MKKYLVTFFLFICVVACAFGFAACSETHTHEWSQTWESDETSHWHNCTASGCTITDNSEKHAYATHDFSNGNCICGKEKVLESIEFYLNIDSESYSVKAGVDIADVTEIIIPAVYNEKPVTGIGAYAFYVCKNITSVKLKNGQSRKTPKAADQCNERVSLCGLTLFCLAQTRQKQV